MDFPSFSIVINAVCLHSSNSERARSHVLNVWPQLTNSTNKFFTDWRYVETVLCTAISSSDCSQQLCGILLVSQVFILSWISIHWLTTDVFRFRFYSEVIPVLILWKLCSEATFLFLYTAKHRSHSIIITSNLNNDTSTIKLLYKYISAGLVIRMVENKAYLQSVVSIHTHFCKHVISKDLNLLHNCYWSSMKWRDNKELSHQFILH